MDKLITIKIGNETFNVPSHVFGLLMACASSACIKEMATCYNSKDFNKADWYQACEKIAFDLEIASFKLEGC